MAGSSTNNSEEPVFLVQKQNTGKGPQGTQPSNFQPKEEHGYAETVVAPTIHSLTAEHVVRHVSTAKNQATLLKSVDQNPKDNDFTL